ncbi:hypothetical protein CFSAN001628_005039 [Clostridium botulinum CFSAN001628]|nr:hypothetical protein CFSAN001628_005039 [Clostridium botulinum CFSAN001628]
MKTISIFEEQLELDTDPKELCKVHKFLMNTSVFLIKIIILKKIPKKYYMNIAKKVYIKPLIF